MKKLICIALAAIMLAAGGIVSVGAYELPPYYNVEEFKISYDAYRIYVYLEAGYCGVFDELDYDVMFEGAEFISISDSDAAWREAHPEGDVFPEGYDAEAHVRRLTVELYEPGTAINLFAHRENAGRVEKALREFEAFDFVSSVSVVPTEDFDPYGTVYHTDDDYFARWEAVCEEYGYDYEAYVAYCEGYLYKYDVNGDGAITYKDVFAADNAKLAALEAGDEYTGAEPAEIVNFIVTSPGQPDDIMREENTRINAKHLSTLNKYIEICERDGVEYLGPTYTGWEIRNRMVFGGDPASDRSLFAIGDVDGNLKINAKDVVAVMKSIVSPGNEVDSQSADVNCDGKVNAKDVTLIMKIAVNGSQRTQSKLCAACRALGHTLSAAYARRSYIMRSVLPLTA